jgi:hypothetical protein
MSDDSTSPDSAVPAKKTKRVATPRVTTTKTAKKAKATKSATEKAADQPVATETVESSASVAPISPSQPASAPAPEAAASSKEAQPRERSSRAQEGVERGDQERSESAHRDEPSSGRADRSGGWPEPETVQGGSEGSSSNGKRKRRRKKKSGQGAASVQGLQDGSPSSPRHAVGSASTEEGVSSPSPKPQSTQPAGPRVPIDQEDLAKKAWKIFLGEIGEEGLALVGDQEGRELSRRSFKLAEIFLEEKARRSR